MRRQYSGEHRRYTVPYAPRHSDRAVRIGAAYPLARVSTWRRLHRRAVRVGTDTSHYWSWVYSPRESRLVRRAERYGIDLNTGRVGSWWQR